MVMMDWISLILFLNVFVFKQKTAYEMRISDWSSDVCSSDLLERLPSRGFRVRAFTVDEIADAVDVRGVLEGMAVRLLAERGAPPEVLDQIGRASCRERVCQYE